MGYDIASLAIPNVNHARLTDAIDRHERARRPELERLWSYYRNPALALARQDGRTRRKLAQERGLPSRLTTQRDERTPAREVVIENDIAWRIHTMIDFMFGRPITIVSTARRPETRRAVESILDEVWEASGGIGLLQDIGLLGHVYGYVDLFIRRVSDTIPVRIEAIEPTRGIPIIDPEDFRRIDAYVVRFTRAEASERDPRITPSESVGRRRWLFARGATNPGTHAGDDAPLVITHVFGPTGWQRYEEQRDGHVRLVASGPNDVAPGGLPIVHIQNVSQPFCYAGLSEVEALIPLQDELNTRLSDRANRVTMQSFKMYLAKGMETPDRMVVGPGQIWTTDNPDAEMSSFGGDASSPSEDAHIGEIREAMDKMSAVPPVAGGVVRAKIGNLTSENALRVTLMGLLSKTARKRNTYGRGIAHASRIVLDAMDRAGVLRTDEADRDVRVEWPDPFPREERDALDAARQKLDLGIPRDRVLAELGYAPNETGIN